MTGEVVRYQPAPPERLSNEELKFIQNSTLLPAAYRGKPADIFACVLLGRQLGIGDMHALRSIYVVDGKATIGAELMVTLIRRAGHSVTAEYGDGQVTVSGRRVDSGDEMTVTWTLDMARRAGLLDKQNWKRYPESMLWARAVSQLGRMLFADVLAGMSYTPDEAELSPGDRIVEAVGELAPPLDDPGPDDTPAGSGSDETGALTDPDVIDVDAVDVTDTEGGPEAEPAVPPVTPADDMPVTEPAPPSDTSAAPGSSGAAEIPPTDDGAQGSIFERMAEGAQKSRRQHRDPA